MTYISRKTSHISLVIPILNEENNIPVLYKNLKKQLAQYQYEIIFVNDGSTDKSAIIIEKLHQKDKQVKLINLSRNFGQQIAISCGLDYAQGDAAIIIDADLQDPPQLIQEFIKKWQEGYDVVYGIRTIRKGEQIGRLMAIRLFYQLLSFLSPTKIPQNAGDFRLISKRVITILTDIPERHRFLRGIISWIGFRQIGIAYVREKRFKGRSKYSVFKLLKLGLDGLLSFSFLPLRLASFLGGLTAFCALIYLMYTFLIPTLGRTVEILPLTVVLILLLGSIQLMSLGIIGEYVGRIYEEIKRRPLYIVDSVIGFSGSKTRT